MKQLEIEDIQGIIQRGYGKLESSYYIMLEILDASKAKPWISDMADVVRNGEQSPIEGETCLNLAFTQKGLEALNIMEAFYEDQRFSVEFEDSMYAPHRAKILGDTASSAPENWQWGGPNNRDIHMVLMMYASNQEDLDKLYAEQKLIWESKGVAEVIKLDTELLPGRKEHFGFRDGIAQPNIAGLLHRHETEEEKEISSRLLEKGGADSNILAAGEFILGYPNVYEKYPSSPKVKKDSDVGQLLDEDDQGTKDLGKNGSYLVFRQLEQHVDDFWKYLDNVTKTQSGESDAARREKLAAKMVGRWRSGCPLIVSPDEDKPEFQDSDDFNYYPEDADGQKCPMASHIRRTNPRNSPLQRSDNNQEAADVALRDANKHRILRRGRAYGKPIAPSMIPEDILAVDHDGHQKVGLHFICFNANLGRQFEFMQHTWVNNPKFAELYSEADPLLGDIDSTRLDKGTYGDFTAPGLPLRERTNGLTRFVDVKGGAYFFMPGIKALKYLSKLP